MREEQIEREAREKGKTCSPCTEIDHHTADRNVPRDLPAVLLKEQDLVSGLVELGGEDDVGPDVEADVIVEKLIGQHGRLLATWLLVEEGHFESAEDTLAHGRAANVEYLIVGRNTALEGHCFAR